VIYCNSSNYTDRIDDIGIVAFEGMVDVGIVPDSIRAIS
jgi:hypothetical protein